MADRFLKLTFVLCAYVLLASTGLVIAGLLDGVVWGTIAGGVLAIFTSGEVIQQVVTTKKAATPE